MYQQYPDLPDPGIYNSFETLDGENWSSPRLREQRITTAAKRLRAFLGHVDAALCTFDEACEEAELALNHLWLSWGRLRSRCPALNSGLLREIAWLGKYVRDWMRFEEEWLQWEDIYESIRSHAKSWRHSGYPNYRSLSNPYPEVWEELADMLREGPPHDLAVHGDPERVDIRAESVRYRDDNGGVWVDSAARRDKHLAHEYWELIAWLADRGELLGLVRRFRWWLQTRVDDLSVTWPLACMVYPVPYTRWADYGRGADRWLPSDWPYTQPVLAEMEHLAGTIFADEASYARALSEAVSDARDYY